VLVGSIRNAGTGQLDREYDGVTIAMAGLMANNTIAGDVMGEASRSNNNGGTSGNMSGSLLLTNFNH
jgi:hypothetical protein